MMYERAFSHTAARRVTIGLLAVACAGVPATAQGAATTDAPSRPECRNPVTDVVIQPGQDISRIARAKPEGTSFRLAAGVYRQENIRLRNNQKVHGTVGPNCTRASIIDGSIRVSNWRRQGAVWVANGYAPRTPPIDVPCLPGYARCGHPHDLFLDDQPLRHAANKEDVQPGRWHFDYANRQLVLGSNPMGHVLTLSYLNAAFLPAGSGITISGLVIRKFASQTRFGALTRTGPIGWRILNNEIYFSHGVGLTINKGTVVRNNYIHDNGQLGAKMVEDGVVFEHNIVTRNNYTHADGHWEAGGVKIFGRNQRLADNCVGDNLGSGLWADVNSSHITFDGNRVFRNTSQGIFYEISSYGVIRNNRVGLNGKDVRALYGTNVMLSTSDNNIVTGNVVEVHPNYGNAITVVWQNRGAGYWGGNNLIEDNDVTFLGAKGMNGAGTDWFPTGASVFATTKFRNNRYHSPKPDFDHFADRVGRGRTMRETQAAGTEAGSTIDRNVTPRKWNCDTMRDVRRTG